MRTPRFRSALRRGDVEPGAVVAHREREPLAGVEDAVMPVVGECDDGFLNDLRGMHVRQEHVWAALDGAGTS